MPIRIVAHRPGTVRLTTLDAPEETAQLATLLERLRARHAERTAGGDAHVAGTGSAASAGSGGTLIRSRVPPAPNSAVATPQPTVRERHPPERAPSGKR